MELPKKKATTFQILVEDEAMIWPRRVLPCARDHKAYAVPFCERHRASEYAGFARVVASVIGAAVTPRAGHSRVRELSVTHAWFPSACVLWRLAW